MEPTREEILSSHIGEEEIATQEEALDAMYDYGRVVEERGRKRYRVTFNLLFAVAALFFLWACIASVNLSSVSQKNKQHEYLYLKFKAQSEAYQQELKPQFLYHKH